MAPKVSKQSNVTLIAGTSIQKGSTLSSKGKGNIQCTGSGCDDLVNMLGNINTNSDEAIDAGALKEDEEQKKQILMGVGITAGVLLLIIVIRMMKSNEKVIMVKRKPS